MKPIEYPHMLYRDGKVGTDYRIVPDAEAEQAAAKDGYLRAGESKKSATQAMKDLAELPIAELTDALPGLSDEDLKKLQSVEKKGQARVGALDAIEREMAARAEASTGE